MTTPYAPATSLAPSYPRVSNSSANLDVEVSLSPAEIATFEPLSELYGIITTLEALERLYLKDELIKTVRNANQEAHIEDNYTPHVQRLLGQYRSLLRVPETKERFGSLEQFVQENAMTCPLALQRISAGVPATLEESTPEKSASDAQKAPEKRGVNSRAVAEATRDFITCMDSIKLGMTGRNYLYPFMSNVFSSLNKVLGAGSDDESDDESEKIDFEGKDKLLQWLIKLYNMPEESDLSHEESMELLKDLETGLKNFCASLE